jgi:hypothetical protein
MALLASKQPSGSSRGVRSAALRRRLLAAAICWTTLTLAACAGVTPPPRFSPASPAVADAPESAVAPPKAMLTGDGELADRPEPTRPSPDKANPIADPHVGHTGEGPKR